ncbi:MULTISPECIES: (2Fe-2S)-binding protein [Thermomonospora]|uniref:Bacterioferritin-associated ferredoxin n=1 Tax=Thermomonospora curvata (strain ATCC 19995 / DSM 43183 / JCM 3096 / KCTC 9072 / NBRC 15933 / NCIMB 10081 / Henssen B9) TaxID=471852 RepID=D1A1Z9_THECD|nr:MULTISPECIES: (2Fe-2S)-binding protein [Thermomonospora]ACY99652.1 BFD domain protein (2Fe-2S)-binding domain protein [Thermomonospora curvata DSM 43183]
MRLPRRLCAPAPFWEVPDRMYVCICNEVTEDDVHNCMAAGAGTVREVKAACGMKPGCGVCTRRLYAMVRENRAATPVQAVDDLPPVEEAPADPFAPTPMAPLQGVQVPLGMPAVPGSSAA